MRIGRWLTLFDYMIDSWVDEPLKTNDGWGTLQIDICSGDSPKVTDHVGWNIGLNPVIKTVYNFSRLPNQINSIF